MKINWDFIAGFAFALIAVAFLGWPGCTAHAASDVSAPIGSQVCASLDIEPTEQGVAQLGYNLMTIGLTQEQAGKAVANQVIDSCPRHLGLIRRYAKEHDGN